MSELDRTLEKETESTQERKFGPLASIDSHMVEAFNAYADALDVLKIVDMALSDDKATHPEVDAVCTVLGIASGFIERARDAAERARKRAPHG